MRTGSAPRLKDVALACGVSVSTVSRALKGHPGIPACTKAKVREAAEKLGYRPDARMNELMEQVRRGREGAGSHNLALVYLTGTVASERARNHIGSYARGVRERADELGYGLLETSVAERANLKRWFRDTGVAGVLLASPSDAKISLSLDWGRFAWAAVGFIPEEPGLHAAVPDFAQDARDCVVWLAERGYRRPGFVHNPEVDSWLGRSWLGGFLAECLALGLDPRVVTLSKERYARLPEYWDRDAPDSLVLHDGQVAKIWNQHRGPVPMVFLNLFSEEEGLTGILPADRMSGANAVDLVAGQLRRGELGIPRSQKRITARGGWVRV